MKRATYLVLRIGGFILSITGFVLCAIAYFLIATYYDDLKAEYLIYNYSWNFTLIDIIVWIILPIIGIGLFILFLKSSFNTKK